MGDKITFIEKARKVHGDKYDYSKVEYINSMTKVCIICPEHGEFWQTPSNHLSGHGCKKCSSININKKRKNNTDDFIVKAKTIHGDKYDYSKVEYINNETKVCIICPEHGEFWQKPSNHLSGQGCPKCGKISMSEKQKMTINEFIEKSNIRHKNFYDYSRVNYKGCFDKVTIICPIHGEFEQTPAAHLHTNGCPKCGRIRSNDFKKLTTEEFINKAKTIHGDKYDYSKVNYIDYDTNVTIVCPIHGEFEQTPDSHLQGKGCRLCNKSISKKERELIDIINKDFGIETINEYRKLTNPFELDIFMPSKKIAIEYNGILWHSEEYGKNKYYHLHKLELCKQKGIKLIQIFEDEYLHHHDIVINKLKHLLHVDDNKIKVPARKTVIKEIDPKVAKDFLNTYHIQGFTRSTIYLGSFYNNEMVGVMTFLKDKDNKHFELNRFASNYNYVCQGIGGKLFSYFIRNYNPEEIKSFADRRWTIDEESNVYTKLGFVFGGYTKPDYSYYRQKDGVLRQHKFNFRKQILNRKYGFPLTMTESEMVQKLECKKIWNCGLIRYIWKNNVYLS